MLVLKTARKRKNLTEGESSVVSKKNIPEDLRVGLSALGKEVF